MSIPIVIGFNAWKKSGKDELCDLVMARYPNVRRHGFADALYAEVAAAFNLTLPQLKALKLKGDETLLPELALEKCISLEFTAVVFDLEFKNWKAHWGASNPYAFFEAQPRSFRSTLQLWGTEYRRNRTSQSYWTDQMLVCLKKAAADGITMVLINDIRFDNEWNVVELQPKGLVVRIIRKKVDLEMKAAIARGESSATHKSELEVAERHTACTILNEEGFSAGMLPQLEGFLKKQLNFQPKLPLIPVDFDLNF